MPDRRPSLTILAPYLTPRNAGAAQATATVVNALARRENVRTRVVGYELDPEMVSPTCELVRLTLPRQRGPLWRLERGFRVRDARNALRQTGAAPASLVYAQFGEIALGFRQAFPGTPLITHTGGVLAQAEALEESYMPTPWRQLNAKIAGWQESAMYREDNWSHWVSTRMVADVRAAQFGLRKDFFEVRPLPIDLERFRSDASPTSSKLIAENSKVDFTFVTVARLVRLKQIDWIIHALARLDSGVHLIIVGDGPERPALEVLASSLVPGRCHFWGASAPERILPIADAFVLPSRMESFGLVYAEAMACGLPAIGLRYSAPDQLTAASEVIEPSVTGLIASDQESLFAAMARLAAHPELCKQMGIEGRKRAERLFSADVYAAQLERCLEESLARRGSN